MMTASRLAKFFADRDKELLKFLNQHVVNNPPSPEPKPFKPEPVPKNETHLEMLQCRARDDVRTGRAISSNALQRPAPEAAASAGSADASLERAAGGTGDW